MESAGGALNLAASAGFSGFSAATAADEKARTRATTSRLTTDA